MRETREMTEQEMRMIEKLEEARKLSETMRFPVFAMSNGNEIEYTWSYDVKRFLEDKGYWVCSIFEHGDRVLA